MHGLNMVSIQVDVNAASAMGITPLLTAAFFDKRFLFSITLHVAHPPRGSMPRIIQNNEHI